MGLDQVLQNSNSNNMRRQQHPQPKKLFGDHGHEVSSNSVFVKGGGVGVKSVSTAHQCLRKILSLISRSSHGHGHSQLECPQNNVGLEHRKGWSFFQFLGSKHEENEKRRIGQKVELNLNSAPEPQSHDNEDGHGLNLGVPVAQASEASHSNFYYCSNTVIQHEYENVDGGDLDKKKWWESGGGQWHPSNNNNTNNNSCVESENVSVLQRSSEGEYDPKIDVNFPASESVAVAIDLNNLAECDEKEGSTEIQCDSKYEHEGSGVEVEVEAEAEKYGGECSHESEVQRDYSGQCRQERYGGLDLLVEAIGLANGDLDVFDKEKKKNRGKKQQAGNSKRRKGAPIDTARQERPSLSAAWVQQEEEEENSVEDRETKKVEIGVLDWYDTAPLVRSKRGRNQALPSRFRDSVIEPWKRMSRPRLKAFTQQNSS